MKNKLIRTLSVCIILLAAAIAVNAQAKSVATRERTVPPSVAILKGTGKVAVIVVGSATKIAWETTKLTTKYVAKPVAAELIKPIVKQAVPVVGNFIIKNGTRYILPFVIKFGLL